MELTIEKVEVTFLLKKTKKQNAAIILIFTDSIFLPVKMLNIQLKTSV
jgi:hypothetical protein